MQLQLVVACQQAGLLQLHTDVLKANGTVLRSALAMMAMVLVSTARRQARATMEQLQSLSRWDWRQLLLSTEPQACTAVSAQSRRCMLCACAS